MPTPRYQELKEQMRALEAEMQKERTTARAEAVKVCKAHVAEFGLTPADLGMTGKAQSKTKKKSTIPAKYRSNDGQEWSGRGRQPQWMTDAINEGKRAEDFEIRS